MNMNIKNEKTMLALIVVAALAMVSVAGVALASESDAATTDLTIVSGDLDIKSSTTDSYGIYNTLENTSKVIIAEDAAYSGTLCFGSYDSVNGKFTSLVTFTLTDVSNVVFKYVANEKVATVTGNTTGTIAISQGSVILGSTDTDYFTGEISGNTATIAAVNVAGFTIKAGTTDVLSGALVCGSADGEASIDMTGTANVGTEMKINDKVTFTVAEDATLNVPANAQTYSYSEDSFEVTVMGGTNLSGYAVGGIYDSDGQEVANITTVEQSSNTLTFTRSAAMNMSEKYTVQILIYNETNVYYYSGSLSFTVAADGMNATTTFTSSTNASKIALADSAVSLSTPILKTLDSEGKVVTYDSADYYVAYTAQTTNVSTAPTNADVDRANGTITFGASIVGESATTLIVLENKTSGALSYYFGNAKSVVTPVDTTKVLQASKGITALGVSTTDADYKILSGHGIEIDDLTPAVSTVTNEGTIDVEGKIFVGYYSVTACGKITNEAVDAVITVDGTIEYQVAKGTTEVPLTATSGTEYISAVCYEVAPASTSTQAYTTFYYTTLANAMAAASDMTVYGTITVLEDMTLTGTPVGTETTQNKITVAGFSTLNVGRVATTGDDAVTAVTAVVTVPKTTQVMINVNGTVNVANGQYKVEGLFSDSYGSSISANVFMTDDTYGIYTDLATALGLATAEGDVINLRSEATLAADATLVAGVTLNANNNDITIASGTTFTVNGILNADEIHIQGSYKTSSATVGAGELVLNCYDEDFAISKITTGVNTTNGGIITLGSEFDTGDYSVAFEIAIGTSTSKIPAVINIDGVVDYSGDINTQDSSKSYYLTLNVTGTLNTVEGATVDVRGIYAVANITGTLYSEVAFGVCEMYVTGTGSVSFGEDNGACVFVNDKLVSGTAATDVESVTNNTTVKAVINRSIYAVVYGDYTADNISIYYEGGGNDSIECSSTVYYVLDKYSATYVFKTLFGADAVNLDLTEPEFESYTFDRWYDKVTGGIEVKGAGIGDHTAVYGYTTIKTFTVSFSYNSDNGVWIVDGNRLGTSGTLPLEIGSHSVSYVANDGYELKDYAIYVNGEAMTDDYEPQNGDVIKFTGTVEQKSTSGGMDLITILLIIITIVIVIMAIIIALKLMRS